MSIQEMGGVSGDWGPDLWADASATVQPNGPQVMANSIVTQSTVQQGQDQWTGWLQGVTGKVVDVWAATKARANGLTPAVAPNGQPTYVATRPELNRSGAMTPGGLLVIGLAVAVGVLLVRK